MLAKDLTEWRLLVLERDNYTYQLCGIPANVADHIVSRNRNPQLIFDIENGRILCRRCHSKYGDKYRLKIRYSGRYRQEIQVAVSPEEDKYYKRYYKMSNVGREGSTTTVTIPPEIILRTANKNNLTVADFIHSYRAVVYYGGGIGDGAFIRFEKKPKKEKNDSK